MDSSTDIRKGKNMRRDARHLGHFFLLGSDRTGAPDTGEHQGGLTHSRVNPPETDDHPRGALALTILLLVLIAAAWFYLYFVFLLPRGEP